MADDGPGGLLPDATGATPAPTTRATATSTRWRPRSTVAVDPQIGWEVQKFLIAWTVAYIKANEKTDWTDMMRIWRLGVNAAPRSSRASNGRTRCRARSTTRASIGHGVPVRRRARTAAPGGKMVQKGIAARVLEYANELTASGYKLD